MESPASQVELSLVVMVALAAPLGWFGGWLPKWAVTQLIPGTLRAYPIAALLWAGAIFGLRTILRLPAGIAYRWVGYQTD